MSVFTSLSLCFFHCLPQSLLLTPPRIRILSRLPSHVMHEVRSGVPCDSLAGSKAYMAVPSPKALVVLEDSLAPAQ